MQAKAESCSGRERVSSGSPAANYVGLEHLHRLLINQEHLLNFAQWGRGQCTPGFDGDGERTRFIPGIVTGEKAEKDSDILGHGLRPLWDLLLNSYSFLCCAVASHL